MKPPFDPWLPKSALDSRALTDAVRTGVLPWADKWFARRGPHLSEAFAPVTPAEARENLAWQVLPGEAAVGTIERATGLLASAILDGDLGNLGLSSMDRRLVERLVETCLEDLRAALARLFAVGGTPEWRPQIGAAPLGEDAWAFRLSLDRGAPLIRVVVGRHLVVRLRRAISTRASVERRLRPLEEGLSKQRVRLSARLGRCELALAELEALAPGDVLVLDRRLDEPLELAIEGQVKPGRCSIGEECDHLLLKISIPPAGRGY